MIENGEWCLHLLGLQGQYEGQTLDLTEEVVWLGRASHGTQSSPTHFLFMDQSVSRAHAALVRAPEYNSYVLHHRSQTNPTFLNDVQLTEPKLLKEGDKISFGLQALSFSTSRRIQIQSYETMVDEDPPPPPPPPQAAPSEPMPLNIGVRSGRRSFFAGAKKSIVLQFTPDAQQVEEVTASLDREVVTFKVPAVLRAEMEFVLDPAQNVVLSPTAGSFSTSKRVTSLDGMELSLPIKSNERLMLTEHDTVRHEDCEIWLPEDTSGESSLELDLTSSQSKEHLGILEFQSGPWRGARLAFLPGAPSSSMELGPKSKLGSHAFPIVEAPTCQIVLQGDEAKLEVVSAKGGQYASIDGELLFAGQDAPLLSGSMVMLGRLMLNWIQPKLQASLKRYKLEYKENSYPIPKSQVKIGTAAHCEILVSGPGLSPVTGILSFGAKGFVYKHQEPSIPALVDGVEVPKDSEATVQDGSTLELGLGCVVKLVAKG